MQGMHWSSESSTFTPCDAAISVKRVRVRVRVRVRGRGRDRGRVRIRIGDEFPGTQAAEG